MHFGIQQVFLGPSLVFVASWHLVVSYGELSGFLWQRIEQVVLPECWDAARGPYLTSNLQGGPMPFRGRLGTPFSATLIIVTDECIYLHRSAVGEQAESHSFYVPSQALGWKELVLHDVTWPRMVLNLQASFCDCMDWIAVEIKNTDLVLHMWLFC